MCPDHGLFSSFLKLLIQKLVNSKMFLLGALEKKELTMHIHIQIRVQTLYMAMAIKLE